MLYEVFIYPYDTTSVTSGAMTEYEFQSYPTNKMEEMKKEVQGLGRELDEDLPRKVWIS